MNKRTGSIALFAILITISIFVVSLVMTNGSTPIGPPTVTPGGGGSLPTPTPYLAYDTIQDEGSAETQRRILNCVGDLISCSDDAGNSRTNVTITNPTPQPTATPGGGGGGGFPFTPGRAVSSGATNYYTLPGVSIGDTGGGSTVLSGSVTGIYYPIAVYDELTLDQVGLDVSVASGSGGSVARICLYESDTDFQPTGTLISDYGTVATDSTGVKTISISETLSPGEYLLLMVYDVNFGVRVYQGSFPVNPALQTTAGIRAISLTRYVAGAGGHATGGCPSTGTAWNTVSVSTSGNLYHVFSRIGTP